MEIPAANAAQRRRWNDRRWTSSWPNREQLTSAATPHLLDELALRRGERVLDVGSGGGTLAMAVASEVGRDGSVLGVDVSEGLSSLARRRAEEAGLINVEFVVADAQTDALGSGPFDVVTSQFGVMFFDLPTQAFANLRAHLRPGGRLVFCCWQHCERNPWHSSTPLAPFVAPPPGDSPGQPAPGPFSLAEIARTEELLQRAGFHQIACTTHDLVLEAPASAVFDPSQLEFLGVAPEHQGDAHSAVAEHLAQFQIDEGLYGFPLAFAIFAASASP